jgi:hypothetical protein
MLNMQRINYVATVLGTAFLLGQPIALAQPSLEGTIDSSIRNNSIPGASKESNAVIVSLKKWMGPYQKLEKTGSGYNANFEKGSLPIAVSLKGVAVGCPKTAVPLSKAPANIKKTFGKCPNLTP